MIKIKTRSYGGLPYKKRLLGQTYTEERPCEDREASHPYNTGRGLRMKPTLLADFGLLKSMRKYISVV